MDRRKLIACAVAGLMLLSIVSLTTPVKAEDAAPTLLAKLDLNDEDAFVFGSQIIGFNDDGSFYHLSYCEYNFGGGAYIRISLITADLKVQWSRNFNSVMTLAIASDGGISVMGANSSYPGIHVFMFDRSGGEQWASQYPPSYLSDPRLVVTEEGYVVVGERNSFIENSTTATVFDSNGNILDLILPDELRNTTLPLVLKNGTLAAQRLDRLYGLSSDLEILWELPLPQPIFYGNLDQSMTAENIAGTDVEK